MSNHNATPINALSPLGKRDTNGYNLCELHLGHHCATVEPLNFNGSAYTYYKASSIVFINLSHAAYVFLQSGVGDYRMLSLVAFWNAWALMFSVK